MSRRISQTGLNLVKSFEGCRLQAYYDQYGKVWTIGYGQTGGVSSGMSITQAQADEYLRSDLSRFEGYVNNASFVPFTGSLNQNQFDALVSFAYNCGQGNLRSLCSGRSISAIPGALLQYNKAGGKVLPGLTRRRQAEAALFNSGGGGGGGGSSDNTEQLAREVIAGKWGNGEERKRRLEGAGHNYRQVQDRVNAILRGGGSAPHRSVSDIAREVIRGNWGNGEERRRRLEAAGYNYRQVQDEVNRMLR